MILLSKLAQNGEDIEMSEEQTMNGEVSVTYTAQGLNERQVQQIEAIIELKLQSFAKELHECLFPGLTHD